MTHWADIGVCRESVAEARIPPELWYGDWREAPPPARTLHIGSRPVEAPDDAAGFVRLMALVMIDRAAGDEACTEQHLGAAGFTAGEIRLHADRARELARRHTATRDGQARGQHRALRLKYVKPVFRVKVVGVRIP